jgi:hypothetical protein
VKKSGCALFGCAVFIGLLALAALSVLRGSGPEPPPEPVPSPPSPESEREAPVGLRAVRRDPDLFHLTFHFRDPEERLRKVTCAIRRSDYERERAGFGFVSKQMEEELNQARREALAREAATRGVARYFTIEVFGEGSLRWTYSYPPGTDPAVAQRVKAFHAWLDQEAMESLEPLTERYYREHGLRLERDTLSIDYEPLALNASEPLADCFTALRRADGGRSRWPLGLFLTFFQDLRYELPRDVEEDGRETLGFRVPTAVMVEGAGDCDSKAVAFCALWRQLPARALLVLVPGHALVAVEGKPGPDQTSIRLGNRYFIPCEVAGPGRFRPGETKISGSFEYVLIEPAVR